MTTKKTSKKTTKKRATKRKPVRKKTAKKRATKKKTARQRFDELPPSMSELEHANGAPWPWPLRPIQQNVADKFKEGIRRFGLFWHRRAGKDVFGMSMARNQMTERVGSYVHFFPKHVHAKRALWRGVDPRQGKKFIDIAFGDIEVMRNNQDMVIEAFNGSTWTLLGSDNYDSNIIGGNVVGVVFSEWALCNPMAWEYIRPILRENNGWAMFITTFRGRNHAWQMAQKLKDNPDWFIDIRDITQTSELDGSPIISLDDVDKDRQEGMKESLIQQEYFCNPEAVVDGAIYGSQVEQLREDTTRHFALYDSAKPVYCIWNLDLPIHASYLLVQPGPRPKILHADMIERTDLASAVAKAEQKAYPIMQHLLLEDHRDLFSDFQDLERSTSMLYNTAPYATSTRTGNLLTQCSISYQSCELLLDSLGGYVRRERFDPQTADMQYSDTAIQSWHARLVNALESWAAREYHLSGDTWGKAPSYANQDKAARTIL